MDIYRPKIVVNHECINYGLNMYFKKPHRHSEAIEIWREKMSG